MLISEFCRRTGIARETVRFYVRLGLLHPEQSSKGGRNPYLTFDEEDVRSAEVVRVGQAIGLSLKEIAALREKRRSGKLSSQDSIDLMKAQLAKLDAKAIEIDQLRSYVRAKIEWQEKGEKGPAPQLFR